MPKVPNRISLYLKVKTYTRSELVNCWMVRVTTGIHNAIMFGSRMRKEEAEEVAKVLDISIVWEHLEGTSWDSTY